MSRLHESAVLLAARAAWEAQRSRPTYLPLSSCPAATAGSNGRHEALVATQSAWLVRQIGNTLWPTLPLPLEDVRHG